MAKTNPPFMSGVPELLLLRLLGQREMYGYELVRSIRTVTNGGISLGEGVIYPVLHNLERQGALAAERRTVGKRSRVYYRLTSAGQRRLDALAGEWQRVSNGIRLALEESLDVTG